MGNLIETVIDIGGVVLVGGVYQDETFTAGAAGTYLAGSILARDSVTLKLVPFVVGGATNNNGEIKAVLTEDVVVNAPGDVKVRVYLFGVVNRSRLIVVSDGNADSVTAAALDQARAFGIFGQVVQQLARLEGGPSAPTPPEPPEPTDPPLTYTKIVIVGDSEATIFGTNVNVVDADSTAIFQEVGLAVDVYGYSLPGVTVQGATPRVRTALDAHPDALVVVLLATNDVNNTYPYNTITPAGLDDLAGDYDALLAEIGADIGRCIIDVPPFLDLDDLGRSDPNYNSTPYIDNIYLPKIQAASIPRFINSDGFPIIDRYGFWASPLSQALQDPDNIHHVPEGDRMLQYFVARRLLPQFVDGSKPPPLPHGWQLDALPTATNQFCVTFGVSSLNHNGNAGSDGLSAAKVRAKDVIPLYLNNQATPSAHNLRFEHAATATNEINDFGDATGYIGVDFNYTINSDPFYRGCIYIRNTTPVTMVVDGFTPGQTATLAFAGYRPAPSENLTVITEEGNPGNTAQADNSSLDPIPSAALPSALTANGLGEFRFTVAPGPADTFAYLGGFILTF